MRRKISGFTLIYIHNLVKLRCMNAFLSLGRWFFALPFALFGLLHYMNAEAMANMVPNIIPFREFWVYLTGTCLIAASLSMILGRKDKLATMLLAVFLILMVFLMHIPSAISNTQDSALALGTLLRDISLAGGAMMYSLHYAQD